MSAPLPRLLIVDDEAPARARLRAVLSDIAEQFPYTLVGEAATGSEALRLATESPIDIALIDVQMPEMSGLELAQHLVRLAHVPSVIFVTAFDEFALKAFEVHAIDYLLKPVRALRLQDALVRAIGLRPQPPQAIDAMARERFPLGRSAIAVSERGRVVLVSVDSILYLKAELKYVTIRTADAEYLTEESLVALEDEFADRFVRVHRNALVARMAVESFERVDGVALDDSAGDPRWVVALRGLSERLPVSRRQWPIVRAILAG